MNMLTKNENKLSYIELNGIHIGDVYEYANSQGIINHYVISYLFTSMKLNFATILFSDGYSENINIDFLKKDKFIKNTNWWNIHNEYIEEANRYL